MSLVKPALSIKTICKNNHNLKNHVLSHYYQVFYQVLPDFKPYPCPDCDSTSRDRITLKLKLKRVTGIMSNNHLSEYNI